jgi:hypothetical protein
MSDQCWNQGRLVTTYTLTDWLHGQWGFAMTVGSRATLALGVGMIIAASYGPPAMAAGLANGAPSVTGSMYNGNNAQPPDLTVHEVRVEAGVNQAGPELQTPTGDNKGGASGTAPAGSGG